MLMVKDVMGLPVRMGRIAAARGTVCGEQAEGRVDLFWIHNGRDSVSLSACPSI